MRIFFQSLFILACSQFSVAQDNSGPEHLLLAYRKAIGDSSFDQVVGDYHPLALRAFKKHCMSIIGAAVKRSSEEAVLVAFQGLKKLSDLEAIPEDKFWVYVMSNQLSSVPKFERSGTVKIVGTVENGNSLYLLYLEDSDIETVNELEELTSPQVMVFRRSGNRWLYSGLQLTAVENYLRRFAIRMDSSVSKQPSDAGTGQTATRSASKSGDNENPNLETEGRSR